jgi:hypothetical protein
MDQALLEKFERAKDISRNTHELHGGRCWDAHFSFGRRFLKAGLLAVDLIAQAEGEWQKRAYMHQASELCTNSFLEYGIPIIERENDMPVGVQDWDRTSYKRILTAGMYAIKYPSHRQNREALLNDFFTIAEAILDTKPRLHTMMKSLGEEWYRAVEPCDPRLFQGIFLRTSTPLVENYKTLVECFSELGVQKPI